MLAHVHPYSLRSTRHMPPLPACARPSFPCRATALDAAISAARAVAAPNPESLTMSRTPSRLYFCTCGLHTNTRASMEFHLAEKHSKQALAHRLTEYTDKLGRWIVVNQDGSTFVIPPGLHTR
jgi:hypothetical protein